MTIPLSRAAPERICASEKDLFRRHTLRMSRKRDKAEVQIVRETPQAMGSAVAAIKTSSRTDRGLSGRNSGPHVCPHYTGYSLRFSVYPTAARAGNWQSRQTSAGGICVSARNVIKTGSHDNACRVACRRFSVLHSVFPNRRSGAKRRQEAVIKVSRPFLLAALGTSPGGGGKRSAPLPPAAQNRNSTLPQFPHPPLTRSPFSQGEGK